MEHGPWEHYFPNMDHCGFSYINKHMEMIFDLEEGTISSHIWRRSAAKTLENRVI